MVAPGGLPTVAGAGACGRAKLGWHHLSDAACLVQPRLFYACFVLSRTIIICYIARHFEKIQVVPPEKHKTPKGHGAGATRRGFAAHGGARRGGGIGRDEALRGATRRDESRRDKARQLGEM